MPRKKKTEVLDGEVIEPKKVPKKTGPKSPHAAQFKKGVSANPNGRPKADHTLRDAIRSKSPEVSKTLFAWLKDPKKDDNFKFKVMELIIERGWGPAPIPLAEQPEGGNSGVNIYITPQSAEV